MILKKKENLTPQQRARKRALTTIFLQRMILAALLTSLSIVLTRWFSFLIYLGPSPSRVGIGLVPIHLAGFILGPFYGAIVGALADVIGVMINSMGGQPLIGLTLTSALHGFIPGLVAFVLKYQGGKRQIISGNLIAFFIASLLLQSYFLSNMLAQNWMNLMMLRLPLQSILLIVYILIEIVILKAILPTLQRYELVG